MESFGEDTEYKELSDEQKEALPGPKCWKSPNEHSNQIGPTIDLTENTTKGKRSSVAENLGFIIEKFLYLNIENPMVRIHQSLSSDENDQENNQHDRHDESDANDKNEYCSSSTNEESTTNRETLTTQEMKN
ncbi:hypothetical protein DAPPUDRAFT_102674 [Daphnia pulex]|uniref:Uncharacterized protein n=1 Tax=Daphnia pulex TaxID=6669 RepID=E9GH48_DAPPU|nr:hypothetical protein DAPPUDRAFT_102674 [Daphnia pulex]|eukprot:EFX81253.1 hypothetical protein DAPPUDRAFT_102674 [Daphnia pulex]